MGLHLQCLAPLVLAGLVAISCAVPVAASAQASAAQEQEARTLFQRGVELARDGKLAEAVDAFERSRALVERHSVLQNLAVALEGLGRVTEALRHVERAIELRGPDGRGTRPLEAQRARLLGQVAYLTVRVEPADASVWVDNEPVSTAEPLMVDPGSHGVRAASAGHESVSRVLSVAPGASHTEQLVLVRMPLEREPEAVARSPAPAPASDRKLARWAFGLLGVGVAVAAAGTAVYLRAGSRQDSWEKRCSMSNPCDEGDAARAQDELDRLDFTAYGLFAASGAALIGAGTLGWLARRERVGVTSVGLSPSGVLVGGRF
jgi:tetratricopeptide (TPR) repeat protein